MTSGFLRLAISLFAAAFHRAAWGRLIASLKVFGTFSLFPPPNGFRRRRWRRKCTRRRATHSRGGEQCPASLRWCRERASASCAVYVDRKVPPVWRCHCVFVGAAVHLPRALAYAQVCCVATDVRCDAQLFLMVPKRALTLPGRPPASGPAQKKATMSSAVSPRVMFPRTRLPQTKIRRAA